MLMKSYETVTETIEALRKEGYTEDFNLLEDCISSADGKFKMLPQDFEIDQFFRFEGMTDPDDETIVYAISSRSFSKKGVLVNAYGAYSNDVTDELMQKLVVHPKG
jgi:hypothetical protein